ncbi:MAG: phosphopantothenate--cysteine ligase [Firmicutes bacterium]|nr:phosphopantothenate--cysteine ligase [Bacillota bacterium]
MNILITAGGTKENIDAVRGITNYSTGQLGCLIAQKFLDNAANVTYIHGQNASLPTLSAKLTTIEIQNTSQLQEKLLTNLQNNLYDCVIHAMAVSDYAPYAISATDTIDANLTNLTPLQNFDGKISSDSPFVILALKQQPKIINCIKKIQPNTRLVGFKLLSNATQEELLVAAYKQMKVSQSDYVLANNLQDISGNKHKAILVNQNGIISAASTKQEIAEIIYNQLNEVKN